MSTFAVGRGKYYLDCNSVVINSSVSNSSINMSGGVITDHGTPVAPGDVVNKEYVDNLALTGGTGSSDPVVTVTLTGTAFTTVTTLSQGAVKIMVKNIVSGGPSASFEVCKSESSQDPSYSRSMSSAGAGTNERLHLRWAPGSGIQLRKSGVNFNGQYRVKIESL